MASRFPSNACPLMGAVLAGGASRRMSVPKEGILLTDGRPMIEHVFEALFALCPRIAVVGSCRGYALAGRDNLVHLHDRLSGVGPLGGLEALLASGLAAFYLVATCDQPLLKPALLRRLASKTSDLPVFLRSRSGEQLDPFPCLLPAAWLEEVRKALEEERFSVRNLVRSSPVTWRTIPDRWTGQLRSVNTPEELEALCRNVCGGGKDPQSPERE